MLHPTTLNCNTTKNFAVRFFNMNVLDSPLEALAFNCVSFGLFTVVNNLWTWVAVLTAAVSFLSLRLRAAGAATSAISSSSLKFQSPPSNYDQNSNGSSPISDVTPSKAAEEPPCSVESVPALAKFEDDGVVTKGQKFTLYYEDNGEVDGDDVAVEKETEESGGGGGDEVVAKGCGDWWESVLRLRTGEMGWYRHQDLTELNGNVVRLWDGYRVRESYSHRNAVASRSCSDSNRFV